MNYKSLLFLVGIFTLKFSLGQQKQMVDVQLAFEKEIYQPTKSDNSDFGAVINSDDVWFVSNREYDLVNWGENLWSKKEYYNIFLVEGGIDLDVNKHDVKVLYSKAFNGIHTGPVSFSKSGDTLFYTQVVKSPYKSGNKRIYKPQLFMTIKKNGKWSKGTKLPFNDPAFSYAHPCFDSQTNTLYFASDVDTNNLGGTDLYKSSINESGEWGDIENLGAQFNSEKNEQFPFIWNNKEIFYSSDKNDKDLDIFWSWKNHLGKWSTPEPLGNDINSDADDFSIYLTDNGKKGFVSSNSTGKDQIYLLNINREVTFDGKGFSGRFTYRNIDTDPSNITVQIIDENGFVLSETKTDENGQFKFNTIPYDQKYTLKVQDESGEELILQIFDKNGKKIAVLMSNKNGEFLYKKLDAQSSVLSYMEEDDIDFELNQADFMGQFLNSKEPGVYPDKMTVYLEDSSGNRLHETQTDRFGNFEFKKLNADDSYFLKLEEETDEDLLLMIYNSQDNVIAELHKDDEGNYTYRKIKPDLEKDLELIQSDENPFKFTANYFVGDVDYKKIDGDFGSGLKIQVYDSDGFKLSESKTDQNGNFRFDYLPMDESYLIKIEADDENLKYNLNDLFIKVYDRYGEQKGVLKYNENGYFIYKTIQGDQSDIALIDENENNLELDLDKVEKKDTVIENQQNNEKTEKISPNVTKGEVFSTVYFDLNSSYFNVENKKEMKKVLQFLKDNPKISIEIKSYADSRADQNYNLWISEKRTNRVKEYLISRGIAPSRINGEFYGEKYLVNNCDDGVDCPEEKHRLNRRSEIIIKK